MECAGSETKGCWRVGRKVGAPAALGFGAFRSLNSIFSRKRNTS